MNLLTVTLTVLLLTQVGCGTIDIQMETDSTTNLTGGSVISEDSRIVIDDVRLPASVIERFEPSPVSEPETISPGQSVPLVKRCSKRSLRRERVVVCKVKMDGYRWIEVKGL